MAMKSAISHSRMTGRTIVLKIVHFVSSIIAPHAETISTRVFHEMDVYFQKVPIKLTMYVRLKRASDR